MSDEEIRRGRGRPRREGADDAILEATAALLADEGYERLTLDAVGRRASVAKTTLYRRWSSKSALVVAALQRVLVIERAPDATLRDLLLGMVDLLTGEWGAAIAGAANDPLADLSAVAALLRHVTSYEAVRVLAGSDAAADALCGAVWFRLVVRRAPADEILIEELLALFES